jgi:hypothetical protein
MNSADTLTSFELCQRKAYWSERWERHKLLPVEMLRMGVLAGLTVTERTDYGEFAGEEVVTLAAERGMDIDRDKHNVYRAVMNHAGIADIVTTAIRKEGQPAWTTEKSRDNNWVRSCLIDPGGTYLRRFVPAGSWNQERQEHEIRSWYGLGEVCMAKLPMQMVVAQLGTMNGGRRHGHWSKALLHPQGSSLRFKLRSRKTVDGFKETWVPIWREEHDDIDRQKWLAAMHEDRVLEEVLFVVDIPLPGELEAQRIRDMANRKLEAIAKLTALPEKQLSTCDGPLAPCPFRGCCWGEPETAPSSPLFDVASETTAPTLQTIDSSNPNAVAARFFAR